MLRYEQVFIEGRKLHYATEGSGPNLVLLHGLGFDHRLWLQVAPYLVGHARVLIPDLPGFGGSLDLNVGTNPDEAIRILGAMLTALGAVPAFLVGFGLGSTQALGLAARYPERVQAVVAISALGPQTWPETGAGRLAAMLRAIPGALELSMRLAPGSLAQSYIQSAMSSPSSEAVQIVESILRDSGQRKSLLKQLAMLKAWQASMRRFSGVRAPSLIVWGERDRIYRLHAAERLRHAVPGAQLHTITGAEHLLPLEHPDTLAAVIRSFLGFRR